MLRLRGRDGGRSTSGMEKLRLREGGITLLRGKGQDKSLRSRLLGPVESWDVRRESNSYQRK